MDEKDVAPGCRENVFCQLFAPSIRRLAPFEGSPASMTMLRTQWCTRRGRGRHGCRAIVTVRLFFFVIFVIRPPSTRPYGRSPRPRLWTSSTILGGAVAAYSSALFTYTFTCWAGKSMFGRPQVLSVDVDALWLAILVEP